MKGLVSWLVGVLDHHIPWFTGLIRTSFRWITATAWPWVKELTAPAQSYLRDKRSPARMMRVYNNPWRFLVLLAVVLFICGATMKGSHFMWASLLQAEPKFLSETPKFRHLIKETYLPQIVLGVILLCVWMLGTWLSKSQGMRSVPTLFLSKVDKVIAAFGTWRFEPEFRALMRHRCGRKGGSDMDLLVRTVLDDTERRRNLFYSLERSRIPIAKSYLLMRLNEAMFWNLLLWLVFFFYGQLLIPFLVFPAGRWIPGASVFIQNSTVVKALVTIASLAASAYKVITWALSLTRSRSER